MKYTKIDLHRLKAVVCRLIEELAEETGSSVFQLPDCDFHGELSAEEKMDMSRAPSASLVGRLRDDWEFTHWLADEPTKVSAYSLTEVATLLDFLGNSVVHKSCRPCEKSV